MVPILALCLIKTHSKDSEPCGIEKSETKVTVGARTRFCFDRTTFSNFFILGSQIPKKNLHVWILQNNSGCLKETFKAVQGF